MSRRAGPLPFAFFAALVLAGSQSGCATKFVAKPANPLKPRLTAGWDPGELSQSTQQRLAATGSAKSWPRDPATAIAAIAAKSAGDPVAQRAVIELSIAAGMRAHAKFLTDRGAAGLYLCAAEHAHDAGQSGSPEYRDFCRKASRYAVGRLASLRETALDNGVRIGTEIIGPTRSYHVVLEKNGPGAVGIEKFARVTPSDHFTIEGARELALVEGVGAPLVGKVAHSANDANKRAFTPPADIWLPLTATVRFGPPKPNRDAYFTLHDRKQVETVRIGQRTEPLAGDFSTAFAVRAKELNQESFLTLGILGFLRGDRFFERTGLYPIEQPRPDRIPVVFVHGLISDPNDWRFLHNALLADPEIRQKYQFWAFYYPTSMAVPWSATILRQELRRQQSLLNPGRKNPKLNNMVMIGHSMGGLLSRMQITEGGQKLYAQYFTKPVDRLRISKSDRAMVEDMFFFSPNPDVSDVVFVCVPHQGSTLATNWIGKIGRMLAKLPVTIIKTSANILTLNADALAADVSVSPGTSIDSLSPGGKFATALQTLPISPRVRLHSIIGNRGKAGPLEKTSDGVVPYWSSHIEGVPETIIPSNHSGPEHEQCATEVKQLLRRPAKR